MDIQDAQREVRSVYIGGFWGQLVSSVIWLVSATLGTWVTPKASILTLVIGGFFIFPLTQMLLRLCAPTTIHRIPRVSSQRVRLLLEASKETPHIAEIGVYDARLSEDRSPNEIVLAQHHADWSLCQDVSCQRICESSGWSQTGPG